jgi:hypothetical protein
MALIHLVAESELARTIGSLKAIMLHRTERSSYSCNGRCGAGCSGKSLGNAYTQDCFSHDICSYFNSASGGARYGIPILVLNVTIADQISDPNCGAAYNAAVGDTALGIANGCGRTNPSNAVSKPSDKPICS